jgi:pilus assembly protein CpaF
MTWQLGPDAAYNPLVTANGASQVPASVEHVRPLDPFESALIELRESATGPNGKFTPAVLEAQSAETLAWCRQAAAQIVRATNDRHLSEHARLAFTQPEDEVVEALLNEMLGLGPLEALLKLPHVEDIALNGPDDIWYKARGGWVRSDVRFRSSEAMLIALNRAIAHTGRQAGPLTPIVDGTLRAGHRLNIVTAPLTDPWPVASIRLHRAHGFSLMDMVTSGGEEHELPTPVLIPNYFDSDRGVGELTPLAAAFLHMGVVAGFNILVVGETGVGKTALLGALGRCIPADRRVIVIEDTRELILRGSTNADNCIYFTTRPPSLEGVPPVTQRDLVLAALRQRPDALTVGEARGAEVFDMLKALWTGHRNGLTSVHAHSIAEVPVRISMMLQDAQFQTEVREATVAHWIAKAFTLGLALRRTPQGRRYVEEIVEFTGNVEGAVPVTTPLFRYDERRQRLLCTGFRMDPHHEAQLSAAGYTYDAILSAAEEHHEVAHVHGR